MGPIPIEIVEWSETWPLLFEREAQRVKNLTPSITLHHIGSTSVQGCAAKPVIDIMGVVESFEAYVRDHQGALVTKLAYESLGEYSVPGRDFLFRYDDYNYNLSVYETGDENIAKLTKLRDRLAAGDGLRSRYVEIKKRLARSHPDDYTAYNDMKGVLIAEILES